MFGKRNNPQSLNRYTYVLNNPLRFVDPFGYQAQDPKGDEVPRVIININDAEQQRRKKELEKRRAEGFLDLPLIPATMLHCITGACGNRVSIRQAAIGAATAVGNEAERIRHKVQTLIPDGVQLNVTALYLISVDATITPDLDYFGGIDMPILSGWTGAISDATNGGTLTPRSGFGASLTGIYIADPAARRLNGEGRIGEPDAQNARRSYFNGTAYTATGCYYLCGGVQTSSGKVASVVGAGTPGVFVGASQSQYLFQHPLAKLPNPFSLWRK